MEPLDEVIHDIYRATVELIPGLASPSNSMTPSSPSLQTKSLILSAADLAQSPHSPALLGLVNYSFRRSYINARNGGLLPPTSTTRLHSLHQLCSELGPDGFTVLMFSSDVPCDDNAEGLFTSNEDGATLIATTSSKPYAPTQLLGKEHDGKMHSLFHRPPPDPSILQADVDRTRDQDDRDWPRWENFALAVHPSLQRRGLAFKLVKQGLAEIRSRVSASTSCTPSAPQRQTSVQDKTHLDTIVKKETVAKGKIMLMTSTMLELNEPFFRQMGAVTVGVRRYEPGTLGSRDGFSIVDMELLVDLDANDNGKREEEETKLLKPKEDAGIQGERAVLAKL